MTSGPTPTNPDGGLPRIDPAAAVRLAGQATAAAVAAGGARLAGSGGGLGAQPGAGGATDTMAGSGGSPGPQPGAGGATGTMPGSGGDAGQLPDTRDDTTPILVGNGKRGESESKSSSAGGRPSLGGFDGGGRWLLIFPALLVGTLLWWLIDSISSRREMADLRSSMQLALDGKRKAEGDAALIRDEIARGIMAIDAEKAKHAAALAAAEARIAPLERESAALKKSLADLEAGSKGAAVALAAAVARAEKAEGEVAALRQALDGAGKGTATDPGADLARLRAELDAKDAELQKVAAERQKLEKETGALKSEVAAAAASLRRLNEQYDKLKARQSNAKAGVTAVEQCRDGAAEAIRAKPIRFTSARAVLTSESIPTIAKVASALKLCPGVAVRIEGHTDTDNRSGRNEQLSLERANAVRDALVAAGIDARLLSTAGCGHSNPVFPVETTTAEKDANRRIEFVIDEQRQPCRPQ